MPAPTKKKPAAPGNGKGPGKGEGGIRVQSAEFTAGAARKDQVPGAAHFQGAPEIAFAGRSNVGKSSLLNMLLARRGLARTSNTPGCTRQINFFDIALARPTPKRVVFVDLPGYGYAKVAKKEAHAWKELLEGYLQQRSTLRAVVVLVDIRRGLEEEELELIEFLGLRPGIPVFIAATKIDKLSLSAQKPALARLAKLGRASLAERAPSAGAPGKPLEVIPTSAETGAGRELLWSRVLAATETA
jgi:GTP-binding protein